MLIQATFQDLGKAKRAEEPQNPTATLGTGYLAIPHYHLDLHVHLGASSHPLQLASLKC